MKVRPHFETSRPVEGPLFVGREAELARLDAALDKVLAGRSAFVAVLGARKQGKTSLFHEWMRRNDRRPGLAFVPVQCWAWPDPDDFFREYLRLAINAALEAGGVRSQIGLVAHADDQAHLLEAGLRAAAAGLQGIGEALRLKAAYDSASDRTSMYRAVVRMPESLATQGKLHFQFILDEFQEMERFDSFKAVKQGFGSIYAMLREEWQLQRRCNYVISGSAVSMLRQILDAPSAPFFQHFNTMHLKPLPEPQALDLLVEFSKRSGNPIPEALCKQIVKLIGTNPFYLQVLGEELVLEAEVGAVDAGSWKRTCQRVLFESTGRLFQYFERLHGKAVGNSAMLEKILMALADGAKRGVEIATAIGVTQNKISSKLPLLEQQDLVEREGSLYRLSDSSYALWLRGARGALPKVVAPLVLGDESERKLAHEMSRQGVSLVYQSRASRGSFDLLALYQAHQIGVQVRRVKGLPAYVSQRELGRMQRDAAEMGWHAALAFDTGQQVTFHALESGTPTKRGRRYDQTDVLPHILDVLDRGKEKSQ